MRLDQLNEEDTRLMRRALQAKSRYDELENAIKDRNEEIRKRQDKIDENPFQLGADQLDKLTEEGIAFADYVLKLRQEIMTLEEEVRELTVKQADEKKVIDMAKAMLERNDAAIEGGQKLAKVMHPGEMLAEKVKEMGWGADTAAITCGMSTGYYNDFIAGRCGVDGQARARCLEQGTKIPAHLWLELQRRWDDEHPKKD